MKEIFSARVLPNKSIFIGCSSHEPRCLGVVQRSEGWHPEHAILFHYDDENPKREIHHSEMEALLHAKGTQIENIPFTELSASMSLRNNVRQLSALLNADSNATIVFDISVVTKRHLLMMLRWLDDEGFWGRLVVLYSEPEDYDVSEFIPLSFGLSTVEGIPGFPACADLSRPLHLLILLGYEGDRAQAVYENVQPMRTTLAIPNPPYKPTWGGRTEKFNADLIAIVGKTNLVQVDAVDPDIVFTNLKEILDPPNSHDLFARIVSPLGTKPQTLGLYYYLRACADPPTVIYARPLRHNHNFFSHGIGNTWLLKKPNEGNTIAL